MSVQTAFEDPLQLQLLLNADGLFPVIYDIQKVTVPMLNTLIGVAGAGALAP